MPYIIQDVNGGSTFRDPVDRTTKLAMPSNAVTGMAVVPDGDGLGMALAFSVSSVTNVGAMVIIRSLTDQYGAGVQIVSLPIQTGAKLVDDRAAVIVGKRAWYWVTLTASDDLSTAIYGPVSNTLSAPVVIPPAPVDWLSMSQEPTGDPGSVLINVTTSVAAGVDCASLRVFVNGYRGVIADRPISENSHRSFSFHMQATGELVAFKVCIVNTAGVQQDIATALSVQLTLNGVLTRPAKLLNPSCYEARDFTQVMFDEAVEQSVTSYKLYRGAVLVTQEVEIVGLGRYSMRDPAKYALGTQQWSVTAVNAAGESDPTDAAQPPLSY